jgi:hypothetical protein
VTWLLTPSVATRRRSPPSREKTSHAHRAARPAVTAASSKTSASAGPGRLPSPRSPSTRPAVACAARRPSLHGEACLSGRHRCRSYPQVRGRMHATALHGPRDVPASRCACAPRAAWPSREGHDACSPLCARQKPLCLRRTAPEGCPSVRRAWGLDPCPKAWTERRSSTSATRTAREHNRRSPEPRTARGGRPPPSFRVMPPQPRTSFPSRGSGPANLPSRGSGPALSTWSPCGPSPSTHRGLRADRDTFQSVQATTAEGSRARGRPRGGG